MGVLWQILIPDSITVINNKDEKKGLTTQFLCKLLQFCNLYRFPKDSLVDLWPVSLAQNELSLPEDKLECLTMAAVQWGFPQIRNILGGSELTMISQKFLKSQTGQNKKKRKKAKQVIKKHFHIQKIKRNAAREALKKKFRVTRKPNSGSQS